VAAPPDIATPAPPPANAAATSTAPAESADNPAAAPSDPPPVWHPHRKAVARKARIRHTPPENTLALRQDGYADLMHRQYPEAFSLLQQAAALGDAYAPMYLGQAFENGLGVPRNVGQASYWYGMAINRGNAAALSAFNRLRRNPY
jgi:TPR repeat protein